MKNGIYLTREPVTVRPLTPEHAPFLLKWMTDPRVLEFYEGRDAVFTPDVYKRQGFYRSLGFTVTSLGDKYNSGSQRYLCQKGEEG